MRMTKVREVLVAGFAADPNPNVTAPGAGQTYKMNSTVGDAGASTEGHRLCIRFVDNSNVEIPAATADFQTWEKDDGQSDTVLNGGLGRPAFISMAAEASAPSSQSYAGTFKGEIFVQLKAISPSTATKIQICIAEQSSVPG